jgi:hypothetical protein
LYLPFSLFKIRSMNAGNILLLFFEYADVIGMAIVLLVLLLGGDAKILENKQFFLKYFLVFFIFSLFASLIPDVIQFKSNNWVYDNIPLFLCLILFFYFKKILISPASKILNNIIFSLFILFYIFNWYKAVDRLPNSEFYLIYAMFILINSVLYFIQELINIDVPIFEKGDFWFITSVLFYSSSSTLFWMFYKEIYSKYPNQFNLEYLWPVCYNSIQFISCIIFASAIYLKTRQSR